MRKRWREDWLMAAARAGIGDDAARRLSRYATTLRRLAEAQCNGDWPCDNGERKVEECSRCKGLWVRSVLLRGKLCPDCRTEDLVRAVVAGLPGFSATFQGDPRGAVLLIGTPDGQQLAVW